MAKELLGTDKYDSSSYLVKRLVFVYMRPYFRKLLIAILCMLFVAGATMANPWLLEFVIDDIFLKKDMDMLKLVSIAVLFVAILKGGAAFGQNYITKCVGQRILTDLQIKLYEHLLKADISTYVNEASGKLISRFSNDINILRASVTIVITSVAREFFTVVFLVGLMFHQSWELSLIAFAAFPLAIYPTMRLGRRMKKISNSTQERLGHFTEKLDETFGGIRVIKAYQQEDAEYKRASVIMEDIYKLYAKAARTESLISPIMETLGGLAAAAVIWYAGLQVIEGVTTPGKFSSFLVSFLVAYKPMKSLTRLNATLQEGMAAAKRLFIMLDEDAVIKDKKDAKDLAITGGEIEFKNISFNYTQEKQALKNISFKVPKGKTIALVGPSGGGKSTIMNLMLRFYDPQEGMITIDGQNIANATISSLRKNIAFVSQDTILFDDTVAANIAYSKPDASIEQIKKAAKMAAADEFISHLPDGYNTKIGEDGITLSGGQRQRISIARAMLRDTPILLLDEATSALDNVSEKQIQAALYKLMKNRTTIVIAHRLSTIEHADSIYVIKKGDIIEAGTHQELIKKKGEYSKLHKGME